MHKASLLFAKFKLMNHTFRGSNNVASLNLCLREENNNVAFIMPFHSHQPFYVS